MLSFVTDGFKAFQFKFDKIAHSFLVKQELEQPINAYLLLEA